MARLSRVQRLSTIAATMLAVLIALSPVPTMAEEPDEPNRDRIGYSAQLRTDRNIELLIETATSNLAAGQFDAAIEALERVLATPDVRFVSLADGRQVAASLEANRLLTTIPKAHLQRWETRAGAAIRGSIEQAANSEDGSLLAAVASRYECLAAGREGLRTAAALNFDQGRFAEAALLYRKLAENQLADGTTKWAAAAQLAVAWNRAGDLDRARRWVRENRTLVDAGSIDAGGNTVRVSEWMRANVPGIFDEPTISELPIDQVDNTGIIPALDPVWTKSHYPSAELSQFVRDSLDGWLSQGIPILGSHTSHIAGRSVIVRGLDELSAIDIKTGNTLWTKTIGELATRVDSNPKLMENERIAHLYSEAICERLLVDRVKGNLGSDDRKVYGIVDDATPEESDSWSRSRRGAFREAPLRTAVNQLAAWNLANGEEAWKIGGIDGDDGNSETEDRQKCYFHGPVVADGKSLLVVASMESEIRLVSLAAETGKQEWSSVLADVPRTAVTDRRHQKLACPIVVVDGMAICCTSAGAVVAVDLSTRQSNWAFRYVRNDVPRTRLVRPGRWAPERRVDWWNGWQHEAAHEWNGAVIVATAESDVLRAFAVDDGTLRWESPRGDGLFVAGVAANRLVVVESTSVRGVDPATGHEIWKTTTGAPGGRGAFLKSNYVLPLADGRLIVLRLVDGKAMHTIAAGIAVGNLAAKDNVLLAQSTSQTARLESIESVKRDVAERLKRSPGDGQLVLRAATVERQAGRFTTAREMLDRLSPGEKAEQVRTALRQTIIDEVRSNPSKYDELSTRMATLNQSDNDRLGWLLVSAEALQKIGDFAGAIDACLQAIPLSASNESAKAMLSPFEEGVARKVRIDRELRGRLIDLVSAAPPEKFPVIDAVVQKFLVKAEIQPDPYAIASVSILFTGLPWESLVRDPKSVPVNGPSEFIPAQLRWIELSNRGSSSSRQDSLLALAQLFESRGYPSDAAAIHRQIRARFAEDAVHANKSANAVRASNKPGSPVAREIAGGRPDPWGTREAAIDEGEARYQGTAYVPLPVEADRGSLFDRLSVYLESQGKVIRFQGDEFRAAWQLTLPETRSPLRSIFQLGKGWGIGHLLILKLGTDLFGISPLNDRGEPEAKILWKIESAVREESRWGPPDFRYDVARTGFGSDSHALFDHFNWKMGDVGPVRAGYLCYRDQAKLIAIDPFTGKELWQREQLSRETVVTGDEEHLFLFRSDALMEMVRTVDGKTVDSIKPPVKLSDILSLDGGKLLVTRGEHPSTELARVDLRTGSTDWLVPISKGDIPFRCDAQIIGVIDLNGRIRLLSSEYGREISRTEIAPPRPPAAVHVSVDERAFYVVLSGPALPPRARRRFDDIQPPRNPLVDGVLLAFDRSTGAPLWSQPLRDAAFRLDQPKETPFIVLHYRRATEDEEPFADLVTRCLDKRTGREILLDEQPRINGGAYWTIETRPDDRSIEMVLPNKTVRFQYAR